jgi:myo-inositol catabolism protein IolC
MALGYSENDKLYILAFDHRGSFKKAVVGSSGDLTEEETERIRDAKSLIFDGMVIAAEGGEQSENLGVLVDEEFGSNIPEMAKKHGLKLAMPVEKSGQDMFDFEYGDAFGEHIEKFDPDFSKVLVRYNPDSADPESNVLQLQRLKKLADWLHERDRKFLFELLVPAEPGQLESVGGDTARYDAEVRPDLMIRAISEIQDAGIEVDIWKIEGLDAHADCVRVAEQTRAGGRDDVVCVLLGRGADNDKVDHWLYQAAEADGFIGFAIGRSIWSDPLKAYLDGSLDRHAAAAKIAENYTRFIEVWRQGQ